MSPKCVHSKEQTNILSNHRLSKQYVILIIIIINLLFQTIAHMDVKNNIYKTHITNKLEIIRTNDNQ